jgi:hypothetical protein
MPCLYPIHQLTAKLTPFLNLPKQNQLPAVAQSQLIIDFFHFIIDIERFIIENEDCIIELSKMAIFYYRISGYISALISLKSNPDSYDRTGPSL